MNRFGWSLLIIFSALVTGWLTFAYIDSPFRFWLTGWFIIVCPGMAWARLLRLRESYFEWTLAIALSLALAAIVSGVMLYAKVWSPQWGVAVLIGISVVGVVWELLMANRQEEGLDTNGPN